MIDEVNLTCAPCGKCLDIVCGCDCKCECHDKTQNNPPCIRCGDKGMFKRKYRYPKKGLFHFVPVWLCITCKEEFK